MDSAWRDGLGKTFEKSLRRWEGAQQLDLVLTAASGFHDRFDNNQVTKADGEGALIRGLFRLLEALRGRATVTAIDWNAYESALTDGNSANNEY
jgi:hypothetical protein